MDPEETQDLVDQEDLQEAIELIDEKLEELETKVDEIDIETPLEVVYSQIEEFKDKMTSFAAKDGRAGKDGKDGERGLRGLAGPQGARGERGLAGKDGADGKQGKDGESKVVHDFGGGGNLPGRRWQVNGSIIGASFNDVNIVSPGATAANDVTGKRTTLTIPGGSAEPAAPDTSVQFNDGGSFGGSKLLYDKNESAAHFFTGNDGSGIGINFVAGDAVTDGSGGGFELLAGDAAGDDHSGGSFVLSAGSGGAGGAGDPSPGGGVQITGGSGATQSGSGGSISLTAGNAQGGNSNGGDILINSGGKTGSGVNGRWKAGQKDGQYQFSEADNDFVGILNFDSIDTTDKTFTFPNQSGTLALGPLTSGTYTPTVSAAANTDSTPSATQAQYLRVGSTVTVSGRFTADPTLAATTTSFEMDLPVASNFGAASDAGGVAFCGNIAAMGAEVIAVAANDTVKVMWKSSDVTSQTWSYTYSFQII